MTVTITPFDVLEPSMLEQVRTAAAAAAAAEVDGVEPLSEAFVLALPRAGDHVVATDGDRLLGYAACADDGSVEAFVDPRDRAKGVGTALLTSVLERRPDARPWAHGDLPASRALAESLGLHVVRRLLVLSRAVRPGDEVVTVEPFYDSHAATIALAGGRHVSVPVEAPDFLPDPARVADAITDRTRLLIVNTPHNPTGAVYPRELLEELVALCRSRGVLILADEVYDHLVYEGEHVSLRSVAGAEDIALTVSSAGKAFAVTGWKVGWLNGPAELVGAARAVKQFLTYSSGPAFQRALGAYLPTDDAERHLAGQRERYRDARDRLVAGLREAGLDPVVPAAGYFVVVDLAPWGVTDAAEAAVRWTREAGVTGIPVGALCRPDGGHLRSWLRLAFCKSPDAIDEAMRRLAEAAPRLRAA